MLAAGQAARDEDAALVERRIDMVHDALVEDGLADWDSSAIPDYAVEALTSLVAARCARVLKSDGSEVQALLAEARTAKVELAALVA